MKNFFKKTLSLMSALMILSSATTINAEGDVLYGKIDLGKRYSFRLDGSDNWIYEGGINKFDGEYIDAENASQYESELLGCGYIQIYGDGAIISSEQTKAFYEADSSYWFSEFFYNEKYNHKVKVFVDSETYSDYMELIEKKESIPLCYVEELMTSTVVLDYYVFELSENVGKECKEINDNIPSYYSTGFMLINTDVDISVRLFEDNEGRYYTFYIRKDIPFLVKLKTGRYVIEVINDQKLDSVVTYGGKYRDDVGEDTLPYQNNIVITGEHTEENPYVIDLYQTLEKYQIEDLKNIEEKPDLSFDKAQGLYGDWEVELFKSDDDTTDDDDTLKKKPIKNLILIGVIVIVLGIIGMIIIEFKLNRKEDDE